MKAAEIIDLYDGLINKALRIQEKTGGFNYSDDNVVLVIEGDEAMIMEPRAETEYDSATLEWYHYSFPAWLLDATDAEIDNWAEEQNEAKRKTQEEYNRLRSEQIAAQERAVYLALKAKYEG